MGFVHSPQMQLILLVATLILTFFTTYLIAEVTLTFCEVKATRRQKCLIAFIAGTLLHCFWTYLIYYIGGMQQFSTIQIAVITSPNPFWALVYYYVAVKSFKLSPVRSIKVMSYIYFYWTLDTAIYRILGALFFVQGNPYNYLNDILQQLATFIIFYILTYFLKKLIIKYQARLKFIESGVFNRKRELTIYFFNTAFMYVCIVIFTIIVPNTIAQNLAITLILVMYLCINLLLDLHRYNKQVISNQSIHISTLIKGSEEIRGIKHDFNNILHTYSGYMELEDYDKLKSYHNTLVETAVRSSITFDLSRRMPENPALVSLLLEKHELAIKKNVKMKLDIKCGIEDFYINSLDFVRIIAFLLDNAIEAAELSADKLVHFTCEPKENASKLIIIANSTPGQIDTNDIFRYGMSSKPNHTGIGLNTVKKTLNKYVNSSFQMKYYNGQLSAYLEFHNIKS